MLDEAAFLALIMRSDPRRVTRDGAVAYAISTRCSVTTALTLIIGVLLGMVLTRRRTPRRSAGAQIAGRAVGASTSRPGAAPSSPASVNFADVAARLNPAVVNIDATARRTPRAPPGEGGRRGVRRSLRPPPRGDAPRRGPAPAS